MKKAILLSLFSFLFVFTNVNAGSFGKDKLKMLKAAGLYSNGDYEGALKVYKEVYNDDKENQKDPELLYLIGRCYLDLNRITEAVEFLENAYKIDPKVDKELTLRLGQAYQKAGNLDGAEKMAKEHIALLDPAKVKGTEGETLLNQCKFAREQIANPQNITFKNLGPKINTDVIESNPSITADGKTLIFTSRRSDTEGGKVDVNNNQFYEDIYMADWDSLTNSWKDAVHMESSINSKGHDANTSISPDGSIIYIYRNMVNKGSGQIFFSKKSSSTGKWGSPKELEKDVNTSWFETSGCVSADGKWFYFVSEKPNGSLGNGDIWRAPKIGKNEFGKPENLGPMINTVEDEVSVYIHPDGKTLYFASRGHENNMGGYDIFKSTLENGKWTKAVNLGYPINTLGDERHFVLSTDGNKAYYSAVKDGGQGDLDIYELDMSNYGKEKVDNTPAYTGPPLSILKGKVIDSNSASSISTKIDVVDAAGTVINTIESDENGDFFLTVEADKDYTLVINNPAYVTYKYAFKLPKADKGTYSEFKYLKLDPAKK
jgi:Tol biopolymer transport system component